MSPFQIWVHDDFREDFREDSTVYLIESLGLVESNLGSSLGWLANIVGSYCLGRKVEHHTSISTKPSPRPDETHCTMHPLGWDEDRGCS